MPLYRHPATQNLYEVIKVFSDPGQPIHITSAGTTSADAFGRQRMSQPFTLFDSQHRYQENDKWTFEII